MLNMYVKVQKMCSFLVLENDLRPCTPKDMLSLKLFYDNEGPQSDDQSCLPSCLHTEYISQVSTLFNIGTNQHLLVDSTFEKPGWVDINLDTKYNYQVNTLFNTSHSY
jgi:hypothetical protein